MDLLTTLKTFEPQDGFSNFKKGKHSKFWDLSIEWSGSAKRAGSISEPAFQNSGSNTDFYLKGPFPLLKRGTLSTFVDLS